MSDLVTGRANTTKLKNLQEPVKCGWCGKKGKRNMLYVEYTSFYEGKDYGGFMHKDCFEDFKG